MVCTKISFYKNKKTSKKLFLKVEISPDSGVMSNVHAWAKARHAPNATVCARSLLMGVFDIDTLCRSSLKGGKSKRDVAAVHKEALDETKLNAIYSEYYLYTYFSTIHLSYTDWCKQLFTSEQFCLTCYCCSLLFIAQFFYTNFIALILNDL